MRLCQNLKKLNAVRNTVSYNQHGSVTGRLTLDKGSFPILNLPKNFRKVLKPSNDFLVEFDYNAAELRTMLALMEMAQPQEDIHNWNIRHIFKDGCSREEAKKRAFDTLKAAYDLGQEEKRRFPIMDGPSVPWSAMAPFERQAKRNHDQTLKRLAERGGLDTVEAWCVIADLQWRDRPANAEKLWGAWADKVNKMPPRTEDKENLK